MEYAEVMPDAAVRSKLMRRIARKEFLHFNPARINIYYLGGFMIAGITSAIMLFTGSENAERLNPVSFQDKLNKSDTSSVIEIPVGKPIKGQHDISLVNRNKSIRNDKVSHLTDKPKTEALKPAESPKNINPPPTGVSNTFSKNSIFTEVTTDNKRLKSGIKFEAF